jgi:hypothetical protein
MPNAYMVFANANRKQMMIDNPSLKITEIAKKLGEAWRGLSDADKAVYKSKATPNKPRKAKTPKTPKTKKPRKLNPYMKFANANRKQVMADNPSLKITEIAKKLGETWRGLSDTEKAKYS